MQRGKKQVHIRIHVYRNDAKREMHDYSYVWVDCQKGAWPLQGQSVPAGDSEGKECNGSWRKWREAGWTPRHLAAAALGSSTLSPKVRTVDCAERNLNKLQFSLKLLKRI